MEKPIEDILMKNRSYNSCIALGYKLYTNNFRKIFKASWLSAILYGVAVSILGTISSIQLPKLVLATITSGSANIPLYEIPEFIQIGICLLLTIIIGGIIEVLFYSSGVSLLRQHKDKASIAMPESWFSFNKATAWRTLKAAFFYIIIAIVLFIPFALVYSFYLRNMLAQPQDHILSLSIVGIAVIIVALMTVPFNFTCIRYLLKENGAFWSMLPKDYTVGMRHYGYVFIVTFISILAIAIIGAITSLPVSIISQANYIANFGQLMGDPLGMPSYITILTASIFFICGFIQAYIRMTCLFPAYYMYGAIETQEEEMKENMLKNSEIATL